MKAGASLLLISATIAGAQAREPIIDMHLHIRAAAYAGPNPPHMCTPFPVMPRWDPSLPEEAQLTFNIMPPCGNPVSPSSTDDEVMNQTLDVMKRRNIIGMVSGEPERMARWRGLAGDRIIPGLDLRITRGEASRHVTTRSPANVRELYKQGVFKVLGEVMAQYEGVPANDARLEPYWALAEELDIPVGIHMGPGGPADPYFGAPGYRAKNSDPLLLEDVLVKHPKLRVYIMHAGYPMLENLRALLFSHPQVYVDIGSIVYTEPRPAFYRYLAGIVEAGYGDRILFGSDQMIWPGIIEPSIQSIEEAPFLTKEQKRDILYNNAARFLRLSKEEIARHHRM
jgi:predicted TIM-barrel fold metal-dependent hydrolase